MVSLWQIVLANPDLQETALQRKRDRLLPFEGLHCRDYYHSRLWQYKFGHKDHGVF